MSPSVLIPELQTPIQTHDHDDNNLKSSADSIILNNYDGLDLEIIEVSNNVNYYNQS